MRSGMGTQSLRWTVEQEVVERSQEAIRIRARIVTGRFTQSSGRVVFDSERPETIAPSFKGLGALLGEEYSFWQDRRTGAVISVSGGNELMRRLEARGFGGLNWLQDKNLRKMFTRLFGVLPERELAPGEAWLAEPLRGSWKLRCQAEVSGPEVVIQARDEGRRPKRQLDFQGRYHWRAGALIKAEAAYDDHHDMVGDVRHIFSWELSPAKD